jgi:5-methyltetrahydrofolate--homocysteine methyltransferase
LSGSFVERLARGTVLLDGGLGSALVELGLTGGAAAEIWNLERPDAVRSVHAAYYGAGSDVVHTNTFGANRLALERHGLSQRMADINRAGARLAKEAARDLTDGRFVAGDIGPSGRFLPPVGEVTEAELESAFAEQAAVLFEAGVDVIAIETMPDVREAMCAVRGALQTTSLPVMACLTYERKKRGFFTIMGDRPAESCRELAEAGASAVGANCSIESPDMLELAAILLEASPVPVITQPNAGVPELNGTRTTYRQRPEDFARDMAAVATLGASAVGGCCGTDPSFIRALGILLGQEPT